MNVFDSSALLAYLAGEPGAELVSSELGRESACGAANWSEVAQKVTAAKADWHLARALLDSHGLEVEPVTTEDAELAASRWSRRPSLSLGDRLCLSLGERLDATIWTADREWRELPRVRMIH